MSSITEYEGERMLYVEEEALAPTDAISNTKQWNTLIERITAVLAARGVEVDSSRFRRSHYKHGGVTHLTMKYLVEYHRKSSLDGF